MLQFWGEQVKGHGHSMTKGQRAEAYRPQLLICGGGVQTPTGGGVQTSVLCIKF